MSTWSPRWTRRSSPSKSRLSDGPAPAGVSPRLRAPGSPSHCFDQASTEHGLRQEPTPLSALRESRGCVPSQSYRRPEAPPDSLGRAARDTPRPLCREPPDAQAGSSQEMALQVETVLRCSWACGPPFRTVGFGGRASPSAFCSSVEPARKTRLRRRRPPRHQFRHRARRVRVWHFYVQTFRASSCAAAGVSGRRRKQSPSRALRGCGRLMPSASRAESRTLPRATPPRLDRHRPRATRGEGRSYR